MIECDSTETWVWDGDHVAVRFQVVTSSKPVICFVTRECIDEHMDDPRSDADRLREAKVRAGVISDKVDRLIAHGRVNADGTVWLHSTDW